MDVEKIMAAAERVARSESLEVVEVEWKVGKQRFLRVYIDRPPTTAQTPAGPEPAEQWGSAVAGVSHRDCEAVSRQLSVILDAEDLVPGGSYVLEVSSPGLDRKLTRPADYERFAGRMAKISLNEPVENSKFFQGRLAGLVDGNVRIEVKGRVIAVPLAGIRKANLVVEF